MNKDRLERVRRVREIQERALRSEWASAEQGAHRAEDIVSRLAELRAGSDADLALRCAVGCIDPRQIVIDGESIERIDAAVVTARARARDARRAAEQRRAAWQERRQDAEALRRLEARQIELERVEGLAREQSIQDEQGGMRHARARAERASLEERARTVTSDGSDERLRSDQ